MGDWSLVDVLAAGAEQYSLHDWVSRVQPLSRVHAVAAGIAAYYVVIFALRWVMTFAPTAHAGKIGLLKPWVGATHNLLLCAWSVYMFAGVLAPTLRLVRNDPAGFTASMCSYGEIGTEESQIWYWMYMFYVSKYYELLDTVLLVVWGSRDLSLLHLWHHGSVMFETWCWLEFRLLYALYGMLFNTLVHTWMYLYFAVTSVLGASWVPNWIKQSITTLQIVQFLTSFAMTGVFLYVQAQHEWNCTGMWALYVSAFTNGSYLILFVRFYMRRYGKKKTNRQEQNALPQRKSQ
ncbi:Elongation of fatty acids protein sre1 [Porphyridium purpureum]|uniref:Elongation of fatty acids protein n=1 Tax=Porphyridium purpureum TaxID=35688 RepID=A0A5J4YGZ5_PORPP|nr:Elongation of fatty acids protein sre1 [Porphyridium purpureum]|eukprot:POR0284..scf237_24